MEQTRSFWKHCSTCKAEIPFRARYQACNVSTCNRGHTALAFCSVECWDSHVPLLRHRDAWSVEQTAPSRDEWLREQAKEQAQERSREERERRETRVAPSSAAAPTPVLRSDDLPRDVLIVASKLKAYVRARSGMNTSDAVMEVLSDAVRRLCDRAVEKAAQAGRKTVLDRDF